MKKSTPIKKVSKTASAPAAKKPLPEWIWLVAILILTAIAFSPVSNSDFTNWDDQSYVVNNDLIRSLSFSNIIAIFKTSQVMGNYHPLTVLSLAIDYNFFQLSPEGYHIICLIIHMLSVCVIFFLVQVLFKKPVITYVTTVLFAIHPMRVESVAWVSERKDQLYVLFYLAGLLMYIYYLDKSQVKYALWTILFFVLSLLSKGQAVTFPVALFIIDYIRARKLNVRDVLLFKTPLLALSACMGIVAVHAQKATNAINEVVSHAIPDRILFACYSLSGYLTKLLVPVNLSAFYPYPDKVNGSYEPIVYISILGPVILVVLAILCHKQRIVVSGIAFFILNIILLVQLLPVGNEIISERYSYLAYTGLFWAMGYGVYILTSQYASWKPAIIVVCIIYTAWLSYNCFNRTKVWQDSEVLWKDVLEQFPNIPTAQNNLGSYYQKHAAGGNPTPDDISNAKIHFDRAIALQPLYLEARTNRSDIYRILGKADSAVIDGDVAVHINNNYREAHQNRGIAFAIAGKLDSAKMDFDWILSRFPDDADAHANRGNLNDMLGHLDAALDDYNKSLAYNPTKYDTYGNRAHTLMRKGEYERAIQDATTALQYLPNNGNFVFTRAQANNAAGHYADALKDYVKAKNMGQPVSDQVIADAQKRAVK